MNQIYETILKDEYKNDDIFAPNEYWHIFDWFYAQI
jgi:hypothetical protein